MIRPLVFRKRQSLGAPDNLGSSPCKVVTPVRRSTRRSLCSLPEQFLNNSPVYAALEDIPSPERKSTFFQSNPALEDLLEDDHVWMWMSSTTSECPPLHLNILHYIWMSSTTSKCPPLHLNVLNYIWISSTTCEYPQLHLNILHYIWISSTTSEYPPLHLNVLHYIWISSTTCVYPPLHLNILHHMWIPS